MRFAFLSPFYPYRGGIAQSGAALFKALEQRHEVKAFTFTRQYPEMLFPGKTQYTEAGDKDGDVGAVRILDTLNPFTWFKTAKAILDYKPDVLLTKYWMSFFAPSLGTATGILKKKGIITIGILDNVIPHEKKFYDRALTRYFLLRNNAFVVMSQSVGDDLTSIIPSAQYTFYPHPVYDFGSSVTKEDAKRKLGLPLPDNYLLFFGFIRRYKGLDLLLQAMSDAKIRKRNLKLLVAGEYYEDSAYYANIIKEKGIENNIILHTGYIPSEMVKYYFCTADMVVQPYRSATQSGVTQIAYHFDKPMLVTNVGGLPEIVPNGKAGYVVEPSPVAIAGAINDFYDNKREELFSANAKIEKKRFEWSSMVKAIEGLVERVNNS